GAFMLTLPNMNHARPLKGKHKQKPQHRIVLDYLQDNPFITNELVQEILSVKQTRAYTVIREMVNEGLIIKRGSGKEDSEYVLTEQE
ncbi:MAG: hypothetical protein FWD84_00510, partial [Oscillospiraceae bacterium]|nr:hypothetical protein [Oscillospiraceae bacterium]